MLDKVKEELRNVAGKVKFSFLINEDMGQASGWCESDLRDVCKIFDSCAKEAEVADPEGIWHNLWDEEVRPTIMLNVRAYYRAFE